MAPGIRVADANRADNGPELAAQPVPERPRRVEVETQIEPSGGGFSSAGRTARAGITAWCRIRTRQIRDRDPH